MVTYVVLATFTDQGAKNAKDSDVLTLWVVADNSPGRCNVPFTTESGHCHATV
jgi:hypothetical protein